MKKLNIIVMVLLMSFFAASTAWAATTPPAPSDLEASVVSTSKIKLTWDDNSTNEAGFKIERKKSGGNYSQIKTVGKNTTTFTDTGLAANTKYYYRVRAYNSSGNSSYSNLASATTSLPLKAPSDLEASVVSTSKIKLTWDDNSTNEAGFKIERRKSGGNYSQIKDVEADVTSFTDTGLAANTKYYYRVRTYDSSGNSSYSNEVSATTSTPVKAPSDLEATVVSTSKIKLTWDDNSTNEAGFKIERKKSGGTYSQIKDVEADITSFTDTGLAANTKYYYRVRAYNSSGNSSYSNEVSAKTSTPVKAPSDLEATVTSSSKIKLTWDDNSTNETGFKIERKKSGETYSQIKTVGKNTTTYTDTGLAANTKYYYRVRAYDSSENSSYSNQVSAITAKIETIVSLTIGKSSYYVNNQLKIMDTAPIIKDDRALLPVRYVAEAIGAKASWNNDERKVSITLKEKTIDLWIGVSYAKVNNEYRLIDPLNPQVTPIIVEPGRTMLPLRFISENLGAQVDWNSNKKEITVTYPAP